MTAMKLSDEALLAFFQSHPSFRDRLASIVGAVGNLDGDLGEADAAEERPVEKMRFLGCVCRIGRTSGSRRRSGKFAAEPGCIAMVKKTLLAYEIRRDHGLRAAI